METKKEEPSCFHIGLGAFILAICVFFALYVGAYLYGVYFYFFEETFWRGYRLFS